MKEGVDVEFKELDRKNGALPQSTAKEIVAFANTQGGEIYFGIDDDGRVVGVEDVDDTMTRISNTAHDTILPDIIPFVKISPIEMNGKEVVRAAVSVGTERPYYLKREGLTPGGVYVRVGSASVPLGEAGIRDMIMESSGKSWEECRSLEQNLTFDTLSKEMKENGLEFGEAQMKTLSLIGTDSLYTNLALLLSEQCRATIKIAVFQGKDGGVFRERREFSGSLLKQLGEAYQFLDFYNKTKATFSGLKRIDRRDYPSDAIREALLNSIIHRDYLFSGSTIINMFDDRIEFISLGGLVRGLSMDAVMFGVSQSRNPNLQRIFYRLELVESYGTGIRKIIRLYDGFELQPVIRAAEGGFSVTLYNMNEYEGDAVNSKGEEKGEMDIKESIYNLALEREKITRKEVEEKFGFSATKAFNVLKSMCREGYLLQEKRGYQTIYVPSEGKC